MKSEATTPEAYLEQLPEARQAVVSRLREVILEHLPDGFQETMNYGMLGYVVPHSRYPAGYHCNPKLPLPFLNLASQKQYVALYHMGIYADPELLQWFKEAYAAAGAGRLDMGKSCIRFKKPEEIPFELIGELCTKITVDQWIERYEQALKK
ncbi:DUF1801 domain-containing protein [Robiginitalea sp. M366]|uniref:DUF1801 domain-containing protein n=1 Tax=Robiginitalea aestuariiviva TaxID=3036903 RepID=UPI00240D8F3F|nr:DUF1801 domain-containing protein [Robiginitalea aestuariiviva]MDG1571196.1 DUF1801 domain-containing protein [Robiginitalea aestuariiviva]